MMDLMKKSLVKHIEEKYPNISDYNVVGVVFTAMLFVEGMKDVNKRVIVIEAFKELTPENNDKFIGGIIEFIIYLKRSNQLDFIKVGYRNQSYFNYALSYIW